MSHHYSDVREALTPAEPVRRIRKSTRKPKAARVAQARAGGEWTEAWYGDEFPEALRQRKRLNAERKGVR